MRLNFLFSSLISTPSYPYITYSEKKRGKNKIRTPRTSGLQIQDLTDRCASFPQCITEPSIHAREATVTKVLTNDEFVRISRVLRIPEFVDIRRGAIVSYGLLTKFVRPPLNSQEHLEAFLRKWSAFRSYDCLRVLTFFVRVAVGSSYGILTAILRFLFCRKVVVRHPYVQPHGILKSLVGRSYDFRHILSAYINGWRLLSKILCPRITSARKFVEMFDIFEMAIMP